MVRNNFRIASPTTTSRKLVYDTRVAPTNRRKSQRHDTLHSYATPVRVVKWHLERMVGGSQRLTVL